MEKVWDVVVVGAGPTGLALGMELRRAGVDVVILDKQEAGQNTSRAAVVHARTMEVLEKSGVTAELLKIGIKVQTFRIRERSKVVTTVNFSGLETKYDYTLMCPQDWTERLLMERYEALGGEILRPCEVMFVVEEAEGVRVGSVREGATDELVARWVVGCDGMHSSVREMSGIEFEGAAYEESFVLADVEMVWPWGRDEVNLFLSPEGPVIVAPLPEVEDHNEADGVSRFRIVATVAVAEEHPAMEVFQEILDSRGPDRGGARIETMAWTSRFRVHHRVASKLRAGRVMIAGDAAHVHSPAGGQGMNTGIQDAVSLAEALKSALDTGQGGVLDTWAAARLRIVKDVVEMTDRMTRMATLSSPVARGVRNAAMSVMGHLPFVQHALAQKLSELDNR